MAWYHDDELGPLIRKWSVDARVHITLLLLLVALIALNVRLWRQRKAQQYCDAEWSQNMDEVELDVPLPTDKGARDVQCRIMPNSLTFGFKGEQPLLQGTLFRQVRPDECNWQLWPVGDAPPTSVKITLVKAKSGNWKGLLAEEDKKNS